MLQEKERLGIFLNGKLGKEHIYFGRGQFTQ